jgi:Cdc6-like AAA superfamily ATPase
MLDNAFVETADYQSLTSSHRIPIVVGRRGTGKSALVYRLRKFWRSGPDRRLVLIAPEEDQVIGIRPLVDVFGEKFNHLRAGSRIAWRYAIYLEIATAISDHPKFAKTISGTTLERELGNWPKGMGTSAKLQQYWRGLPKFDGRGESVIGQLAGKLRVDEIQNQLLSIMDTLGVECIVLIDNLDEGFEPDLKGVGIVDGLLQAGVDVNTRLRSTKCTVFVRDNIFRAVAELDPDYSRTLEGQFIRLHWDETQLLRLVASRLRVAFNLDLEQDIKVWNRCTAQGLLNRDGFRKIVRLTLYRPRDILNLLNKAFYNAFRQGRDQIINDDIETTAKEISRNRLDELHKEYEVVFPGLEHFTSSFSNGTSEVNVEEAYRRLDSVLAQDTYPPDVQQHFRSLNNAEDTVKSLYSVGFLGAKDPSSGTYVFCHDGKAPTREFVPADTVLVHPCYSMALGLAENALPPEQAEQIYDEYDIEATAAVPEKRRQHINKLMGQLARIPEGAEGAAEFEEWCLSAAKLLWAGHLRNVELHPNRLATQRRDVVASNGAESGIFARIRKDYHCAQVVFEVKNYKNIGGDEYRQMLSYLTGPYGKLGFIITRDDDIHGFSNRELGWIRELYQHDLRVVVVRLTANWIQKLLSKTRSPERYEDALAQLDKLLDHYERVYIGGGGVAKKTTDQRKREKYMRKQRRIRMERTAKSKARPRSR